MTRLFLSSGVECVPGLKSYAFFWFWSLASNRKGLPASNCSTYLVSSTFCQVSASRKTTHRTRSPEARVCRQRGGMSRASSPSSIWSSSMTGSP
ncbi:unnamed protein product [Calypogeia fissa]